MDVIDRSFDTRRDQTETLVKRLVVKITTALLYGHFISVCNTKSPMNRVFPLVMFIAYPVWSIIELLCNILLAITDNLKWWSRCSQSIPRLRIRRESSGSLNKRMGQCLGSFFVAAQCAGTISILARRVVDRAATPGDGKMRITAISGISVTVQTGLAAVIGRFVCEGEYD